MFAIPSRALLLVSFAMLAACDFSGSATLPGAPSSGKSDAAAPAPDSLELIRSDIRDEQALREDTGNHAPSYEVGIATAAAVREQQVTRCEDKPAAERAACRAEANAEWETRRGEIAPSRSSNE